ncbi:hypothetical protein Vadar_011396 [Vaccinium darrowii]|uniref:Uncharacterized protein n=1 Tax=Vaccinium darrowii TaxID=229202 RepID=A0ACB7WZU9_9ERIC|nr:hypothetical protein Vadar_011396 [Vaccinium darrowii]
MEMSNDQNILHIQSGRNIEEEGDKAAEGAKDLQVHAEVEKQSAGKVAGKMTATAKPTNPSLLEGSSRLVQVRQGRQAGMHVEVIMEEAEESNVLETPAIEIINQEEEGDLEDKQNKVEKALQNQLVVCSEHSDSVNSEDISFIIKSLEKAVKRFPSSIISEDGWCWPRRRNQVTTEIQRQTPMDFLPNAEMEDLITWSRTLTQSGTYSSNSAWQRIRSFEPPGQKLGELDESDERETEEERVVFSVLSSELGIRMDGDCGRRVRSIGCVGLRDDSGLADDVQDFYTHFTFVIDSDGNNSYADGLTFFLAPDGSNFTAGGAMGLPINPTTIAPTSPIVAVEFDTFQNVGWDPVNISPVTHVGVDVNSLASNVTAVWYCNVTGGIQNEAWIRYDSRSHNLTVVFTGSTNTTRVNDTIHLIVDLRDYLPEWVAFGFSAATGQMFEINNVKSWDFSSSLQTNVTDPVLNPRPKKFPHGALVGILVGSGKASKESDVYSFGVVALEIACGRKPLDLIVPECQMGLVEWVWDLYGMGRLLEAADPKIGLDFDEREMVRLMIVGLWCAHPNHNFRPKIKQAIQNEVVNIEGAGPDAFVVPPGDLLLIGCVSDVSFIAEVFDMVELRGDVLFVSSRVEVLAHAGPAAPPLHEGPTSRDRCRCAYRAAQLVKGNRRPPGTELDGPPCCPMGPSSWGPLVRPT